MAIPAIAPPDNPPEDDDVGVLSTQAFPSGDTLPSLHFWHSVSISDLGA